MVQYEGQVTKDGDLLIKVGGRFVSLHEFLDMARTRPQQQKRRPAVERGYAGSGRLAVAK